MTATPRLLSGDNPPDLIRLPSMVSLVKDGLLKNLDDYATAFGWDQWPAAQLAQNRVAEDGTRGSGSLYAMGLNYSLTGVFYNKELAAQIGMTEPPDDRRRVRGPAGQGEGRRPAADHAVERHGQRRRAGIPAPEPDGRLRADRADQRLDLPEARRDDRHADQPDGRRAPPAVGRGRLLPEGRRTPSSTPTRTRGSARARACSCSTATGRTRSTTRTCRATSGSSSSRPAEAGGKLRGDVGAADLRHRDQRQERRLRRVLLQLGRHQRDGPPDRRRRRRLEPGRPDRPAGPAGGRRAR